MKILYLDTCISISFLKSDDIFHKISKTIMSAKNLTRIGSPITLLELASVISRQFQNLKFDSSKIRDWDDLNLQERKSLITLYFLQQLSIKFYACLGNEKINIKNLDFLMHIDFSKAIRITPLFSLRTLDNLQIAAALNLRDVKNFKIDYFVTTDNVILEQSKNIQKETNLTIIHPEKLIDVEHL